MNSIFYLPLVLLDSIKAFLPRRMFIKAYAPSSHTINKAEAGVRNVDRLMRYKTKKLFTFGHK